MAWASRASSCLHSSGYWPMSRKYRRTRSSSSRSARMLVTTELTSLPKDEHGPEPVGRSGKRRLVSHSLPIAINGLCVNQAGSVTVTGLDEVHITTDVEHSAPRRFEGARSATIGRFHDALTNPGRVFHRDACVCRS